MGRAARQPDEPAIEFVAVDERAFGGAAGDDPVFMGFDDDDPFDDDAPVSRWLIGVSAAVLVALVGVGVIAAAPWADDTAAPPATTVPAPSTTTSTTTPPRNPATGTGRPATTAPGIVLDPVPDGLVLIDAQTGPGAAAPVAFGWSEVWSTSGATRTSGRWFAVTLLPFVSMDDATARFDGEASTIDVGGRSGRLTTTTTGVATLRFDTGQTDASRLLVVSAFGLTPDELVTLAASIGIDDDRPQLVDDRPIFLRPELLDGFTRLAAAAAARELIDDLLQPQDLSAGTFYTGGIDDEDVVLLQLSALPTGLDVLAALALDSTVPTEPPLGFVGERLVVGTRVFQGTPASVAWWDVGDQRVTVLSTLGVDELIALIPAVRIAGGDDVPWLLEPGTEGYIAVAAADPEPYRAEVQPAGTFELWSTPGASRTQGTWAAIQTLPWRVGGSAPGRRVDVGEGTGVLDEGPAVTTLTWSPDDGSTITVTAHGLTPAEMVLVAEHQARGDAAFDGVVEAMSPVLERPTTNNHLGEELVERAHSTSTFVRPDDQATVVVESAPIDLADEMLVRFVLDGDRGVLDVDGSRTSVITFTDGPTRVIVRSDQPLDDLGRLIASVRRSTGGEWDTLVAGPPNSVNGPAVIDSRPTELAVGVTQSGTVWRVGVDAGRQTVTLDDAGAQDRFMIGDLLAGQAITLRSTASTTFVVVRVRVELGAVVARVTAGTSSRIIALSPVDGDDHLYGALAFSEDGDVTVQLLDEAGRVIDGAS
ncbi:MAG: hypothetical protein WD023_07990 [Ilumatobacteraceae bacterium]